MIGRSPNIRKILKVVERVAPSDSTVIVYGESGTGKELIARAIHQNSNRSDKPFITINCGAIPENLLESELFGHVRGAFTGATSPKPGKFELADGGSIFLDEIGDMSPDLQVKLLRVLEEREFDRVGGAKPIHVDVRVVAATHRDLEDAVQKGTFREDLFYRLDVIPITLPPLRKRPSDIPLLIDHFLALFNRKFGDAAAKMAEETKAVLAMHSWPGNVRELRNMLERLVVLKGEGVIGPDDLPAKLRKKSVRAPHPHIEMSDEGINLNTAVTEFEKDLILQSLHKANWVKNRAAKLLQLNRTTLVEKIKRHQLKPCSNL
ncbi:MAG: AAA domain-containing protein [Desulfobacterales bacterium]|nr:AAA domain-containing protein [Desulfobacterales bacterium]